MELIFEIIVEVFGEIILTAIAELIGAIVRVIDKDEKKKRIIKYIVTYFILGSTIVLITLSMMYSKTFLATIAISYMLLSLLITLAKRINKDKFNSNIFSIIINIIKRIINYSYPILLIVISSIYLDNQKALIAIISLSIITIIILFSIDMYKIWKNNKKIMKKEI